MTRVSALRVFKARAEARALLFKAGCFTSFVEAIDPLFVDAEYAGLVDQVGIAPLEAIVRVAFKDAIEP
jgi:hypothetical protein